jgi:hypothetical protein
MSRFRPINRDIDVLLPPSVQEWLHLARDVVEVVEGLDLREWERADAGRGRPPDHPATLLSLLIDGDAMGGFSSRKIEQATDDALALRVMGVSRRKRRLFPRNESLDGPFQPSRMLKSDRLLVPHA